MAATERLLALILLIGACGDDDETVSFDASPIDASPPDASPPDAAPPDASVDATPAFCADEERDDEYLPGMSRLGEGGYTVILVASQPGPPVRGDNTWTVQVRDPRGLPVDGLQIKAVPYMPDHGHGTAVIAQTTATGNPGEYQVGPVNLWMKGYWTVRLALMETAELDRVTFAFCVEP